MPNRPKAEQGETGSCTEYPDILLAASIVFSDLYSDLVVALTFSARPILLSPDSIPACSRHPTTSSLYPSVNLSVPPGSPVLPVPARYTDLYCSRSLVGMYVLEERSLLERKGDGWVDRGMRRPTRRKAIRG